MNQDLGLHRRAEDRSDILELAPQLTGVGEISIVGERDMSIAKPRYYRLRVLDRRGTGSAVASVADRDVTAETGDVSSAEPLRDEAHPLDRFRTELAIDSDDAR